MQVSPGGVLQGDHRLDVLQVLDVVTCAGAGGGRHARRHQVWSLTQFYSVDFSQSRISGKQVCFQQTHNQGLFASVVLDGVLGPSRLARHTCNGVLVSL